MNCFLCKYIDTEIVKITLEDITELEKMITDIMTFALVWSVGASADYNGRSRFNEQLKMTLSKKGISLQDSYYDNFFNLETQ
jgi:hypothetical protein